jgi:hypothetical protein
MNTLTQEDIKNILVLIARADIKGGEAIGIVTLQQKLSGMLEPVVDPKSKDGTKPVDENTNKSSTEYSLDA